MKLKDYIENLQRFAEEYPNAKVVYAIDSEGNAFHPVVYSPTVGSYKDNDFDADEKASDISTRGSDKEVNAICIN